MTFILYETQMIYCQSHLMYFSNLDDGSKMPPLPPPTYDASLIDSLACVTPVASYTSVTLTEKLDGESFLNVPQVNMYFSKTAVDKMNYVFHCVSYDHVSLLL